MKKKAIYFFIGAAAALLVFAGLSVWTYAAPSGNVSATVKLSVCGDGVATDGEDCDNGDWAGRTCTNLGYAGGTLACSIACTFDTSGCSLYIINPRAVSTAQVPSLYASGLLVKPPTDIMTAVTLLSSTTDITTLIPTGSGSNSALTMAASSTLFRFNNAKFDPTQLTAEPIDPVIIQGFPGNAVVEQAFEWGIAGTTVAFTAPLSVNVYVGPTLEGQTLYVYRSESLASGWGTTGIVNPAACVVAGGTCSFQTTQSSYFAVVHYILPTPTPGPTAIPPPTLTPTPGPPGIGPSATPAPVQAMTQSVQPVSFWDQFVRSPQAIIPQALRVFYADESGKIPVTHIFTVVKTWVDSWRELVTVEIYGKKDQSGIVDQNKVKCDINNDGQCNLTDFSILLYYVGK